MEQLNFWKTLAKAHFFKPKCPFKLTFAITYNCNSKCKTCNIWKKKPKKELSLKEIQKILHNTPFIQWLSLTGGEPFLRNDIEKIAEAAAENSQLFALSIPSNGSLPKQIFKKTKKICRAGIPKTAVSISIDGPQHIHNKVRGINCWKKAMQSFFLLKEVEEEFKNFNAFAEITISPFNIESLEETIQSLRREGVKENEIHFTFMHFSNHYYGNKEMEKMAVNFKKKLKKELPKIKKRSSRFNSETIIRNSFLTLAKPELKNPVKCTAGTGSCFLDCYGNVFPCVLLGKKMGNLKKYNYSLEKLFIEKQAETMPFIDKCNGCWIPCEAYQAMLCNMPKTGLLLFREWTGLQRQS